MKKILVFTLLITIQFSCSKNDISGVVNTIEYLTKTVQYKTLSETDSNLLSLDIYYNSEVKKLKPVVIYVHGGAWCIGDKENQLDNKIRLFKELNYVFVSVNYRLSPFPFETENNDRLKYPIHNIDVADAINWVYNTIGNYGGNNNKIVLLGHSAGAHLVSLTGTNSSFLEDKGLSLSIIKGVATIDTEGYNVSEKIANSDEMYVNAFGVDAISNIEASPIYNIEIGKDYPKFFVGKRGTQERLALSEQFAEKLESIGVEVIQIDGSIYNHEEINTAIGKEYETLITVPLIQFFESCFQ